jgi:hypothetical protein
MEHPLEYCGRGADLVAAALGVAEDEQARPIHLLLQQAPQSRILLVIPQELKALLYHVVRLPQPKQERVKNHSSHFTAGAIWQEPEIKRML